MLVVSSSYLSIPRVRRDANWGNAEIDLMYRRKDDTIPEEHQTLVKKIAQNMVNNTDNGYGCGMQYDDAVQAGYIGLLKAYNMFNGDGVFEGYAGKRIQWAIIDEVRKTGWGSRRYPIYPKQSVEQSWMTPDHFELATERFDEADQEALIMLGEVELNLDDQRVFNAYYIEGLTMMQIAHILCVTESRVSQRVRRIKGIIKEALSA